MQLINQCFVQSFEKRKLSSSISILRGEGKITCVASQVLHLSRAMSLLKYSSITHVLHSQRMISYRVSNFYFVKSKSLVLLHRLFIQWFFASTENIKWKIRQILLFPLKIGQEVGYPFILMPRRFHSNCETCFHY